MNILVLNGSPRSQGNTARMIAAFQKGAQEAGHRVKIVPVARQNIRGCLACEYCHEVEVGCCIQQDDMQTLYPEFLEADMLVFASPIYHYSMNGRLITAINRSYALGPLRNIKKMALFLSSGSSDPAMYDAAITQYKGIAGWWGAEDCGVFTAPGLTPSHALDNTDKEILDDLYRFGQTLSDI